jgi:predicted acyltransferase
MEGVNNRLACLDVLRGFDMFWIIGGVSLAGSLISYLGWPCLEPLTKHLEHTEWIGFTAYDLIFPLFIFISGVAMPFSFDRYLASQQKRNLYFKVIRRAVLLILLGLFYNGITTDLDFANARYTSVLGHIGFAYFWASIIVINFRPLYQAICAVGILVLYFLLMKLIPVPGYGAGVLTPDGNFASFIDRLIVPGQLHWGSGDPEGILMTLPTSVLAIAGALAGNLLKNQKINAYRKCFVISVAGIACLCAGLYWGMYFPIIKKLWTSSFILYTAGWSLLLLAVFYLVVDVWSIKKVFFPFMLIGLNPITIYIGARGIIDFKYMTDFIFGGVMRIAGTDLAPVVLCLFILIFEITFLYILYRKKIFIKV